MDCQSLVTGQSYFLLFWSYETKKQTRDKFCDSICLSHAAATKTSLSRIKYNVQSILNSLYLTSPSSSNTIFVFIFTFLFSIFLAAAILVFGFFGFLSFWTRSSWNKKRSWLKMWSGRSSHSTKISDFKVYHVLKLTSIKGGPESKFTWRFLRTSKSSCSAVWSCNFDVFSRSLSSSLSSSPDSSSLLPLLSWIRLVVSRSICDVSSCLPYFFSAF